MTISLPPELAKQVRALATEEGLSTNEVIREALLGYLESSWRGLLRYGEGRARDRCIGPADVGRLVEEYRAEAPPNADLRGVLDTNVILSALISPGRLTDRVELEHAAA